MSVRRIKPKYLIVVVLLLTGLVTISGCLSQTHSAPNETTKENQSVKAAEDNLANWEIENVGKLLSNTKFDELSIADQRAVLRMIRDAINDTNRTKEAAASYALVEADVDRHNGGKGEQYTGYRADLLKVELAGLEYAYDASEILPRNEYNNMSADEKKAFRQMLGEFLDNNGTINPDGKPPKSLSTYNKIVKSAESKINGTDSKDKRDWYIRSVLTAIAARDRY